MAEPEIPSTDPLIEHRRNSLAGPATDSSGIRANLAFFGAAIIAVGTLAVGYLTSGSGARTETASVAANCLQVNTPKDAFGRLAVDVTLFEGRPSQIEWQ